MASEDQDILAKIGQLAGQINRHKSNQSAGYDPNQQTYYMPPGGPNTRGGTESFVQIKRDANRAEAFLQSNRGWGPSRGAVRGAYSSRGYSRGGRPLQVHRNRTLVLNGNSPTTSNPNDTASNLENFEQNSSNLGGVGQGWVTKNDRHLQLINTSIFEKDRQNRVKAMEETRKLKLRQRDEREKAKFSNHLQHLGGNAVVTSRSSSRSTATTANYELNVQGIRFRVTKNGSKLIKAPDDPSPANSTPKIATIGGVRFYRSKNGNLYRSGALKYQQYGLPHNQSTFRHLERLISVHVLRAPGADTLMIPQRFRCAKNGCKKGHVQVEILATFHMILPPRELQHACILLRENVQILIAVILMFVSRQQLQSADHLQSMAIARRAQAAKNSIVIRKDPTRGDLATEDNGSDISSDEEEEIDGDDVDSDDLDEQYFGGDGKMDTNMLQQDFVQLS
ncbi:hypothetical protein B7494_g171 [Chlorociboria aeruginascens]|nr:hypothetical protein B7494_g171 [Chlorociboria aeruginascens]